MTSFKPMLAKDAQLDPEGRVKVSFPVAVQVKLDGIRACVVNGKLVTRTLKEVQNREIFEALSRPEFEGLDGEIIVGDHMAEGCFGRTSSYVMSRDKTGEDWCYYVFDKWDSEATFASRLEDANGVVYISDEQRIRVLPLVIVFDAAELSAFEAQAVRDGCEGIIVRILDSKYKFGRSGTKGPLLKVKRFKDGEARVVGMYERLHNANEAKKDAFGRTERSSHKANKIGRGDLGGFEVEEIVDGELTGRRFKVGTGFDDEQRARFWGDESLIGSVVCFKHFEVGSKDLPRFPVFKGFRDESDM